MSTIAKFRKNFSKPPEIFNSKIFNVDENKPIYAYIVDYYKSFNSSNFELISWEYVNKPHLIDIPLNRINIKNKKIREDNEITNIVPLGETLVGELKLKWVIRDEFKTKIIEKSLLIPEYRDNELVINGNRVLPIKQIIDTIYSVDYKNKVAIKSYTTITVAKNLIKIVKIKPSEEEVASKEYGFKLSIFGKAFSPFIMYYAKYGIKRTLRYFGLNEICEFIPSTTKMRNYDECNYYKVNDSIVLEVMKGINTSFMDAIVPALIESIPPKATFEEFMNSDNEYWYRFLGNIYSTSKSSRTILKKGRTVATLSFKLALDVLTKNILDLPEKHKKDSWAIVRYMMFHFDDIVKKKHNLKYKRVRMNEYIALGFIHSRDDSMHSYINSKSKGIRSIEKLFHFKPNSLLKSIQRKKETAKLIRYNANINDLQAINLLRYSFAGPQGISTNVVSEAAVDFYPSYLGKLDPNSVSTSSPGVTGLLVPFAEYDENGYFYEGRKEAIGKIEAHTKSVLKLLENPKKREFRKYKVDREKLNYGSYKLVLKSTKTASIKNLVLNFEFITQFFYKIRREFGKGCYTLVLRDEFKSENMVDDEFIDSLMVTDKNGKIEYKLREEFITNKPKTKKKGRA